MYLLMRNNAFMFFPGFILGYLMYGSMHYAIHAWNPPFKWMKPLWRNHHLHHYKDEGKGYGVSTTIWDRVFGTMFDLKKEKRRQRESEGADVPEVGTSEYNPVGPVNLVSLSACCFMDAHHLIVEIAYPCQFHSWMVLRGNTSSCRQRISADSIP